ncbi:protein kinase domain-containing protein [Streptomyces sp. NPDC126499]|uniref:protein kinase domain-containing protein n=1 Tax=Streptomyces sp. NPDC126499 TaxID=3155314 RepID=UPI00331DE1F3
MTALPRDSSALDGFPLVVEPGYRVGAWTVERPLGAGAFASVYAAHRTTAPATTPRTPGTGHRVPATDHRAPATDDRAPGTGTGTGHRVPGTDLPETVALKFLPTGTRTPRGLRHLKDLAEREIELLSRLRAPRLIRLYETLTVDDPADPELDGATVLVLEQAERSLQSVLDAAGPTPLPDGPALLVQICEGLHQLHDAGWVHGDLKPGNVLLMADGGVRLGDFSTACELEGTHAYGPGFATPDYTPPELLWPETGVRGVRVRPSGDIWAFGVLAHLVLTGTHPLPGGTPAARRDAALGYARGTEDLRLSPALPEPWRRIVADCLGRTHETRYPHDATLLLERVREAARGRVPRRRGRARALVRGTVLVAAGAVLGLGAGPVTSGGGAPEPGYERCTPGAVCFFGKRDGKGEMCLWQGSAKDWAASDATRCPWAITGPVRSVFNNGFGPEEGTSLPDVDYYAEGAHQQHLGCLRRGTRLNFSAPVRPRSHAWVTRCTAPSEL